MARRKNYTTEQLKEYVDGYVRQKNDYSVITATALADYCHNTLHLFPAVTYQTFTRDKEVMQYIDKINKELHERMLIPATKGASAHIDGFYIDETASAEEVRQKAYEELEKKEDMIRELQTEYQRQSNLLAKVTEERDTLLALSKDLEVKMVKKKEELTELRKDIRRSHHLLALYNEYFKKYLYDPIVLRHVSQQGWISDKKDAVRRCSVNADVIAEIEELYKGVCDTDEERIPSESKRDDVSHPTPATEEEQIEVVNSESAAFLSRLRSL